MLKATPDFYLIILHFIDLFLVFYYTFFFFFFFNSGKLSTM